MKLWELNRAHVKPFMEYVERVRLLQQEEEDLPATDYNYYDLKLLNNVKGV